MDLLIIVNIIKRDLTTRFSKYRLDIYIRKVIIHNFSEKLLLKK